MLDRFSVTCSWIGHFRPVYNSPFHIYICRPLNSLFHPKNSQGKLHKSREKVMENKEVKPQPKRGLWKPEEDLILRNYVEAHGEGNWAAVSKKSGLMRGAKSCRLRWKNYLRPNIKRGGMSQEEEDLIIRMHKLIGNRWSLIAGRLPGRTDNEVKNYWNTHLNKKCRSGKRKAIDLGSSENNNDSSSNKLPQLCDSQPISSGSTGNTAQGLEGREEDKEEKKLGDIWTDRSGGSNFNYDMGCGLIPPNNATFVFDDEPLIAYLDSFVVYEAF